MVGLVLRRTLKNKNAARLEITKAVERNAQFAAKLVEEALMRMAQHTPRYSGNATEQWRLTFDKTTANVSPLGSLDNSHDNPLNYAGGIGEWAGTTARKVVWNRNRGVITQLKKNVLQAKDGKAAVYLVNHVFYAQYWLNPSTWSDGLTLRDVNQDYWDWEDLRAHMRQFEVGKDWGEREESAADLALSKVKW